MARKKISNSSRVGSKHKYVAAATPFNCIANSPDQDSCARTIVPFAAGSFSALVGADGVDEPIPNFPATFVHTCDTQSFTCSVACVVYY